MNRITRFAAIQLNAEPRFPAMWRKGIATAAILLLSVPLGAQDRRTGRENPQPEPTGNNYIVVFKDKTRSHANSRAKSFRNHRNFDNVASAAVTLSEDEAKQLASDPEVEYVAPDRPLFANLDVAAAAINANVAWTAKQTGKDIGVAVIDSGINESVKDLGDAYGKTGFDSDGKPIGRIVYNENFLVPMYKSNGDVNNDRYKAKDDYGHGTHIAGIIAGNGFLTPTASSIRQLKGISPEAMLINLKVLDAQGRGTDSRVIEAIDRAISLKGKVQDPRHQSLARQTDLYELHPGSAVPGGGACVEGRPGGGCGGGQRRTAA